jgi:hypothetical protein
MNRVLKTKDYHALSLPDFEGKLVHVTPLHKPMYYVKISVNAYEKYNCSTTLSLMNGSTIRGFVSCFYIAYPGTIPCLLLRELYSSDLLRITLDDAHVFVRDYTDGNPGRAIRVEDDIMPRYIKELTLQKRREARRAKRNTLS